jgi:tRNA pseudouridine38-40 synthase
VSANIPVERWPRILNRVLPEDLRIVASQEESPGFHARFCAEWRRYTYRILLESADPFRLRYAYGYDRPLDVSLMQHAAQHLVGEHDFAAFTEELDPSVENTVRTLYQIQVSEWDRQIEIEIVGTAFLRGMMRRISGCLLEVGAGLRDPKEVAALLTPSRDRLQWPVVLPAKGLTLEEVRYGNPPVDHRTQ